MDKRDRIYIAGHTGLVGGALSRVFRRHGFENLVVRSQGELDLTNSQQTNEFFEVNKPDVVILAAAKVGGILANMTYPADFIRINLQIQNNVIDSAFRNGVKRLLFLGSSCIYPKTAPQPMKEEYLLTGPLEPTNQAYAIAKIAGIVMCNSYRTQHGFNCFSVMPTNLFGPGDNFDLNDSHVLPALIRRFHEAKVAGDKSIQIWGTGAARREFLFVDDMAEACLSLLEVPQTTLEQQAPEGLINIGVGKDISIAELSQLVSDIIGFKGVIEFDATKPDGMARKLLDVTRVNNLGWTAKTTLREGIELTYKSVLANGFERIL